MCSSTTRISLDKVAAAIEEKFRTTTAALMPSLAECARMTRAEAVALAGKPRRVIHLCCGAGYWYSPHQIGSSGAVHN